LKIKELFTKIKLPLIQIKLTGLKTETGQEIFLVAGFLMIFIGVCGYDWRIAFILSGWMLMKFSGLVKWVVL
jgi:hypothetical protein